MPGSYRVTITIDGQVGTAECAPGDLTFLDGLAGEISCESNNFTFTPHTLPLPEELTIEVAGDGVVLRQTFEPDYEGEYPNGKLCGEACSSATLVLGAGLGPIQ